MDHQTLFELYRQSIIEGNVEARHFLARQAELLGIDDETLYHWSERAQDAAEAAMGYHEP